MSYWESHRSSIVREYQKFVSYLDNLERNYPCTNEEIVNIQIAILADMAETEVCRFNDVSAKMRRM